MGYEHRPGDLPAVAMAETGLDESAFYDQSLSDAGELARSVLVERAIASFSSRVVGDGVELWDAEPAAEVEAAGVAVVAVDLDRRQLIDPAQFGNDRDLHIAAATGGLGGVTTALALLLAASNRGGGRGGGDFRSRDPLIGSWAGDHVGVVPAASVSAFADISVAVRDVLSACGSGGTKG